MNKTFPPLCSLGKTVRLNSSHEWPYSDSNFPMPTLLQPRCLHASIVFTIRLNVVQEPVKTSKNVEKVEFLLLWYILTQLNNLSVSSTLLFICFKQRYSVLPVAQSFPLVACCRWPTCDFAEWIWSTWAGSVEVSWGQRTSFCLCNLLLCRNVTVEISPHILLETNSRYLSSIPITVAGEELAKGSEPVV